MGSPASSETAAPRPVVRRGVVIVHGVGEPSRGDYIGSFVEPLASFIADGCGSENVSITVRNEAGESAWATLGIKGDTRDEEWHIREAWWAQNFRPSGAKTVLAWAIIAGLTIMWATWKSIFYRAVKRVVHSYQQMDLSLDDLYGRPIDPATGALCPDTQQGLWVVPQSQKLKAVLDGLVWLFICILYLIGAVILVVGLVPLYLFLLLPLSIVAPGPVVAAQRKIAGLLVSSIGDQQAMTTRRFALAGASNEVSQALWWMLSKDGLARSKRAIPGFTGYETVTVVAHSGGCVVSFDALAGEVKSWMDDPELPAGISRPKHVGWITAGSGLNLAFRMRRTKDPRENAFWQRPLSPWVNWVNIYARYDPVPQGPPPPDLVATLLGEDPWLAGEPDFAAQRPAYVCLRVVNTDFPSSDHFSYWRNSAEVMSRVVALIADSARSRDPISPNAGAYPATLSSRLDAALQGCANPDATRKSRAAALRAQAPMYVGMVVVGVILVLGASLGCQFLKLDLVDDLMPHSLFGMGIDSRREWMTGVVVALLLALVAAQLVSFVRQLFSWSRAGGSGAVVPAGGILVAAGVSVFAAIVVVLSRMLAPS